MGLFSSIRRRPTLPSADELERQRQRAAAAAEAQDMQAQTKRDRLNDRESAKVAQYFQERIYTEIAQRAKLGAPLYDLPIWTTRAVHDPMRWGWATDMALAKQVGGPMRLSQLMRDFDFQKMVEDRLREALADNLGHPMRLVDFERFDGGPGRGQSDWLITVARGEPKPKHQPPETVSFLPPPQPTPAPAPSEPGGGAVPVSPEAADLWAERGELKSQPPETVSFLPSPQSTPAPTPPMQPAAPSEQAGAADPGAWEDAKPGVSRPDLPDEWVDTSAPRPLGFGSGPH